MTRGPGVKPEAVVKKLRSPSKYLVTWTIDVDASGPRDAAKQALAAQQPGTSALVFEVVNKSTGKKVLVDLWE